MPKGRSSFKRSVMVLGCRTSITLEPQFYAALKAIAGERGLSFTALVNQIEEARINDGLSADGPTLSSALRVHALLYFQRRAQPQAKNRKPHLKD